MFVDTVTAPLSDRYNQLAAVCCSAKTVLNQAVTMPLSLPASHDLWVHLCIPAACMSFMQAGAVFWNGRGDGDVRTGLFIEQQLADDIR